MQTADASTRNTDYLSYTRGMLSWVFTLDHKRLGLMYLAVIGGALGLGALFAVVVQTELLAPGRTIMGREAFNTAFSLHGAFMIFLVTIPVIPAVLGHFLLPMMLGASNLAFPRLALASFHLWLIGVLLAVMAMFAGGIDTGWTLYAPYSLGDARLGVVWMVLACCVLGASAIMNAANFIVTTHRLRPAGMGWFGMPLFVWSLYATSIVQLIVTPVLFATGLLLVAERVADIGVFDPNAGGDPVLFQHLFWFYAHPAVFIMVLPGLGIVCDILAVHSRRGISGYRYVALSMLAIAAFSFLSWGQHTYTSGQGPVMNAFFSAMAFAVLVPYAIIVFNLLATLRGGSTDRSIPVLYAAAFILHFTIACLSGLFLGNLGTGPVLEKTCFVVGHLHYLLMGGAFVAFIAGLHQWWPKMTGRMYSTKLATLGWLLTFVGFNTAFFPQFILGAKGVVNRSWDYGSVSDDAINWAHGLHLTSGLGSYVLVAGLAVIASYLIHSLVRGEKAEANPWGGRSLEWATSSPPPVMNFDEPPVAGDCYDFTADADGADS
jgi:cytochrome c oxidase subunit 1